MNNNQSVCCHLLLAVVLASCGAGVLASDYIEATLDSGVVPGPVEYAVLLPDGYSRDSGPYPLLLNLHGGGGSRDRLRAQRAIYEEMWRNGSLSPMVVVTPSVTERSFYMDFRDGSQKWETFLVSEFLPHLQASYPVRTDKEGTLLTGISMGGMGSLRLLFKYPETFGAAAALEPGIDPVIEWEDMQLRHRWWRGDALLEEIFGSPFDADYWEANNPATLVARNPERIRSANLSIYIECGDEDLFWLYEATEFMHRVLYDNRIRHEYHLVRGADHVGASLDARTREGLAFLEAHLHPPPPDPVASAARQRYQQLKDRLGVTGHYDD
jgi:S-formylglutathione hydrolase